MDANRAVNNAIFTITNDQIDQVLCSDGDNRPNIAWWGRRTEVYDIHAPQIDKNGNARWTPKGLAICLARSMKSAPSIVSDSAGREIIAWRDDRISSDKYELYQN